MALQRCYECGSAVSSSAYSCPSCGARYYRGNARRYRRYGWGYRAMTRRERWTYMWVRLVGGLLMMAIMLGGFHWAVGVGLKALAHAPATAPAPLPRP